MKSKTLLISKDIVLRLPSLDFAETLFQIINNQRDYLQQWLPWIEQTNSLEQTVKFLKTAELFNKGGQKLMTFIFYKNQLVGSVALVKIFKMNHSAELGYWISEKYQGKGIVTRSCERLIKYAFEKMKLNRIEINITSDNLKSLKIPHELGFQYEGTIRESLFMHDDFFDIKKYSLLFREWKIKN